MLKSTDVMAPPKSAPQYRDVSRMIAEVGGIVKVSGSRMATPLAPPSPGSTPMTVPSKIPTTAMNTLNGVMARWKPWARFSRPTRSVPQPGLEGALGHGHQEPLLEDDERHHGNRHRQPDDAHPAVAAHPPHVERHVHGGGDVESHELHEDDDGGPRPQHLQHRLLQVVLEVRSVVDLLEKADIPVHGLLGHVGRAEEAPEHEVVKVNTQGFFDRRDLLPLRLGDPGGVEDGQRADTTGLPVAHALDGVVDGGIDVLAHQVDAHLAAALERNIVELHAGDGLFHLNRDD